MDGLLSFVAVLPHTIPPIATIESIGFVIGLHPILPSIAQPAYEIRLHPAGNSLDSRTLFVRGHASIVDDLNHSR
ncbi:hypothetical protein RESH_06208 [Rhodopirellula europaea SH398]|uniref:Uncharacterized protein n=1 Tax=Rhodopirellula europaea SH398 TaxID=1263868 RepID=M5RVV4_9BACT|nr:hypothetical protein RESH_06208 [Rhodopirellula europaea SH398]